MMMADVSHSPASRIQLLSSFFFLLLPPMKPTLADTSTNSNRSRVITSSISPHLSGHHSLARLRKTGLRRSARRLWLLLTAPRHQAPA
uniref:Putative secreted protein n=1 Tax=Anopheles triannulatus TaxID=58253 RepID=A0A2M4B0T3_9DIPT